MSLLKWTDPKELDLEFYWPKHNDPVASLCFWLCCYDFRVPTIKKSNIVIVIDIDHFLMIMIMFDYVDYKGAYDYVSGRSH